MPDFCGFWIFCNFFQIIYEKKLDFFKLRTHNMRAFKLRSNEILVSTPEISRINRNIVNKSSSSILIFEIQKSVQEEICRQLNLELSKL